MTLVNLFVNLPYSIKPVGKTMAPIVRRRPGALVTNQGDESVERERAQPNPKSGPYTTSQYHHLGRLDSKKPTPMKLFMNILSNKCISRRYFHVAGVIPILIWAFLAPIRDINSVVCAGVKASILWTVCKSYCRMEWDNNRWWSDWLHDTVVEGGQEVGNVENGRRPDIIYDHDQSVLCIS